MQKPGLYLHVPFCRTKCPYCGFYSIASTSLLPGWIDAVNREAAHYTDRFQCFDSLYIGGGTPSLLKVCELGRLLECLFKHFEFALDTEITIEANPCDINREKVDGIKGLGFNRINIGVQSLDDLELKFLGRRHTAEDAEKAFERLRASGFKNIGVDLIYGFQGQSLKGWIKTLKRILIFRPEHISCYELTFEKRTLFSRMKEKGLLVPLSEKEERSFFLLTSRFLEENGYIHYEISSFARKEVYCSRHNRKYWHHAPYLGLGPSAHSFQNSTRWWNYCSVKKYSEALNKNARPVEGYEILTNEQMRLESIALGLRTRDGFHIRKDENIPGMDDAIVMLEESGFLRVDNGRAIPTKKGLLVADYLPLYLIP